MKAIQDTSGQDQEIQRGGRNKRLLIIGGATAAALLITVSLAGPALARLYGADIAVSRQNMRIAQVVRGDLLRDVSAQGKIVAANSPTLYAPSSGVVTINVKAGDKVEKGALLATIDSPELRSRYDQEQAKADELQIEVSRQEILARTTRLESKQKADLAEVDLEAAQSGEKRALASVERGLISKIDLEQAVVARKKADLAYTQAKQNIGLTGDNLQFELEAKKLQYGRQKYLAEDLARQVEALTLRAPTGGVVGSVNIREKDTVAANAALITVVDLSVFEVEADVPEVYVDDMSTGLSAKIQFNGNTYDGTLVAISPEVVAGKVVTRIAFDGEPPAGLRQNQRVSASIVIESKSGVLKVQRGDFVESGGGRVTYVVDDRVARRQAIELGARGTGEVEITSGLREGQRIVTSSLDDFNSKESIYLTD